MTGSAASTSGPQSNSCNQEEIRQKLRPSRREAACEALGEGRIVRRIAGAALVLTVTLLGGCDPKLPDYPKTDKTVWLEQNWQPGTRDW